jgi:hypothetical protein
MIIVPRQGETIFRGSNFALHDKIITSKPFLQNNNLSAYWQEGNVFKKGNALRYITICTGCTMLISLICAGWL